MRLTKLSWDEVCAEASKFMPLLQRDWPQYVEEIRGKLRDLLYLLVFLRMV